MTRYAKRKLKYSLNENFNLLPYVECSSNNKTLNARLLARVITAYQRDAITRRD